MNASAAALRIAIVGNPNSGKTALFNQLTGTRQKVANYAGVTIERKEGFYTAPSGRTRARARSARARTAWRRQAPTRKSRATSATGVIRAKRVPDLIVCVADATNLRLHLRFVLELKRLGRPIRACAQHDGRGRRDAASASIPQLLQERLGMPVVETIAVRRGGTRRAGRAARSRSAARSRQQPNEHADLHAEVRALLAETVTVPRRTAAIDDAIDRVVLHPVLGLAVLAVVMFLIFQAVFTVGQTACRTRSPPASPRSAAVSAICCRPARCAACSSTACSPGSARCWCSCRRS